MTNYVLHVYGHKVTVMSKCDINMKEVIKDCIIKKGFSADKLPPNWFDQIVEEVCKQTDCKLVMQTEDVNVSEILIQNI